MRRFMQVSFAFWLAISLTLAQVSLSAAQTGSPYSGSDTDESGAYSGAASGSHFDSSGYTPEQNESRALTDYLKQRKLPLVGAQVLRAADGQRLVVLYGFVGSDFGRADAAKKARLFLRDSTVQVDNRINVRPELLASNGPSGPAVNNPDSGYPPAVGSSSSPLAPPQTSESSPSDGSSSYPGPDSYKAQQASPYAQQLTSMLPLVALLGALGMSMAGGNSGFSFGSSPFGSPSYGNPYSSPYGSYGSPYGGSPFGGSPYSSPYGRAPYGSSPYGSSPYGNPPPGSAPYPYP
jgi:hypothetical protein